MNAEVIVKFRFDNVCNEEDLKNAEMNFEQMVKYLIKEEGIVGVVDMNDYTIESIRKII